MAKKKFYAVATGRRPGIYHSWPQAEAQVKGVEGAKFKGFFTMHEAESWLKDPVYRVAPKTNKVNKIAATDIEAPTGKIIIYTDGGSINNPGPGGYGAVILYNDECIELSGGYRLTTNNRMELMGCIAALRKLDVLNKPVVLYSDSSYVVNGISKGWAAKWRKNGWRKANKEPALNTDLWSELLDLTKGLDISFNWVKGHSGNPLNERCDKLAVSTARRSGLPEDIGYRALTIT